MIGYGNTGAERFPALVKRLARLARETRLERDARASGRAARTPGRSEAPRWRKSGARPQPARRHARKARQHGVQRQTGQAVDMRQRAAALMTLSQFAQIRPDRQNMAARRQRRSHAGGRILDGQRRVGGDIQALQRQPVGLRIWLGPLHVSRVTQDWNGAYASCSSAVRTMAA